MKNEDKDPVAQMEQCRKPIIGAINRRCITVGFEIVISLLQVSLPMHMLSAFSN